MISDPENPTPAYIEERLGRDVRVVRHQGEDVCGRLVAFDDRLHIDEMWMGQQTRTAVPFEAVKAPT